MKRLLTPASLLAMIAPLLLLVPLPGNVRLMLPILALAAAVFWPGRRTLRTASGSLIGLFLLALLGPLFAPFRPDELVQGHTLLGEDDLGLDLFSRILYGHRNSIYVATACAILNCLLSCIVGGILSLSPKPIKETLRLVIKTWLSIPLIVYFILGLVVIGGGANNLILIYVFAQWCELARIFEARLDQLRQADFVQAARMRGMSETQVFMQEMLPNLFNTMASNFLMVFSAVLIMESSLSFLGLGYPPGTPTLGGLLQYGVIHLDDKPGVFFLALLILVCWLFCIRTLSFLWGRTQRLQYVDPST